MGRATFDAASLRGVILAQRRETRVMLARLQNEIALQWEVALQRFEDEAERIAVAGAWYQLASAETALVMDADALARSAAAHAVQVRRDFISAAGRHAAAITPTLRQPAFFPAVLARPVDSFFVVARLHRERSAVTRNAEAAIRARVQPREIVAEARRVARSAGPSGEPAFARDLFSVAQGDAMTTYRQATGEIYRQNGIREVFWVSARNNRTCLACLALDGKRFLATDLPPTHPRCRCTTIGVTPITERIYTDTGEDWLAAQPESVQRAVMGGANFAAWKAGAVTLDDFIGQSVSPALGPVITQQSLRGILGDAARDFYRQ